MDSVSLSTDMRSTTPSIYWQTPSTVSIDLVQDQLIRREEGEKNAVVTTFQGPWSVLSYYHRNTFGFFLTSWTGHTFTGQRSLWERIFDILYCWLPSVLQTFKNSQFCPFPLFSTHQDSLYKCQLAVLFSLSYTSRIQVVILFLLVNVLWVLARGHQIVSAGMIYTCSPPSFRTTFISPSRSSHVSFLPCSFVVWAIYPNQ